MKKEYYNVPMGASIQKKVRKLSSERFPLSPYYPKDYYESNLTASNVQHLLVVLDSVTHEGCLNELSALNIDLFSVLINKKEIDNYESKLSCLNIDLFSVLINHIVNEKSIGNTNTGEGLNDGDFYKSVLSVPSPIKLLRVVVDVAEIDNYISTLTALNISLIEQDTI